MHKEKRDTPENADIHSLALKRFSASEGTQRDQRKLCVEDRRFYAVDGAQWEGKIGEQFANKPRVSVNKVKRAIDVTIAGYSEHNIDTVFKPKDGVGNGDADSIASLYRADKQDSCAEEAEDTAFEEGVSGGMGAWILRHDYADGYGDSEEQRIGFEPIHDADRRVFFDVASTKRDKSDAKHAWLLHFVMRDDYKEEYGDDPVDWPASLDRGLYQWASKDTVTVAEYYVVEEESVTYYIYRSIATDDSDNQNQSNDIKYIDKDFEEDDNLELALEAQGMRRVREYKKTRRRVKKYIMSGGGILRDGTYIAGENIPIIPYYGNRTVIDGIEYISGDVRSAKDPQRLLNAQVSQLLHISSLTPVEKAIITPEQIRGHELTWAEDNVKNNPYLLLNPVTDGNGNIVQGAAAAGYTKLPSVPPALAALIQLVDQYINDILGAEDNPTDISRGISGVAVELMHGRLDRRTFKYLYNFGVSMKRSGEVWLSMARDLYVESGRRMKAVDKEGGVSHMKINTSGVDKEGARVRKNDLSRAAFDVTVNVGPGSSTKRNATVRALSEVLPMAEDPQTRQMLIMTIINNIEGEGVEEIRRYAHKQLVGMGVVEPTEEEREAMRQAEENQEPSAEDQYLEAEAAKARADTVLSAAKSENERADTEKKQAETDKIIKELNQSPLSENIVANETHYPYNT